MEKIINEVTEKLNRELNEFFSGEPVSVDGAERYFGSRISEAVLTLLQAYCEKCDQELLKDKAERKKRGLSIERRGDKREILTRLGRLVYERTYYRKASGGYEHPVDSIVGVEAYERVSGGVGLALVEASLEMSYEKASTYVTGAQVSRQTVLNKVRAAKPRQELVEYRPVRELHIDADEELNVRAERGEDETGKYWQITASFPFDFIKRYAPEADFSDGAAIRANVYKCGKTDQEEHYASWSPVGTPGPNFHMPEFFGEFVLE